MSGISLRAGVVAQLAPKALTPDPDNPRKAIDDRAQTALVESVKASGVLVPLAVRKGDKGSIVVVHGHRRLAAAKAAKLKTVPVILVDEHDAAERRLRQVAVNNLHEHLAPMDTARMLRQLRDQQKLTPNDLAARMDKAGTPMTLKEIETAIALTDLPDWAASLVDTEQADVAAGAVLLQGTKDRAIAGKLQASVKNAMGWRGKLAKVDAERALASAYRAAGVDLTATYAYEKKEQERLAHFNWKTRCKGCEHLRAIAGEAYCVSAPTFKQHNDEAKAAGLGIGGKKPEKAAKAEPEKLTPKQKAKLEKERAERREESTAKRADLYLDAWLRRIVPTVLPKHPDIAASLVLWHAVSRPTMGAPFDQGGNGGWREQRSIEQRLPLVCEARRGRLDLYVNGAPTPQENLAVALTILPLLGKPQLRTLAHFLEISVVDDWKADADYVALRTREQLEAWLLKFGLDHTGKVSELRQRLLDHAHTLQFDDSLPHMQALSEAYLAPVVDEKEAALDWAEAVADSKRDQNSDDDPLAKHEEFDNEDDAGPDGDEPAGEED